MRPEINPSITDPTFSDGEWRTVDDAEGQPHVIPRHGPKHELSMRCWCYPVLDTKYTEPAVSHNLPQ